MKQAGVALLAIMSWTLVARAGPKQAPTLDHYQVGKRLFEQKRYAQALEEFRQALALAPRPEALYSMAQTQRLLGDCASAVDTYRAFLAGRPDARLAEYARANIERCERGTGRGGDDRPAWYRDIAGDALVGTGLATAVAGVVVWRAGRAAAVDVTDAPDYQTFLQRRSAASSALTEQRLGIAAMIVGGVAVVGGVWHYVHHARSARRESSLGVVPLTGGVMIAGGGTF